jgi:RNA chaperone Hfq
MNHVDRPLPARGTARTPPPARPPSAATTPVSPPLVQPAFIAALLNRAVILEGINGAERRGVLRGFDLFSLFVEVDGRVTLVYKHAVSAITAAP